MNKQSWTLMSGMGLGAGLMYLLDPENGGRRRAVTRDKAVHSLRTGGTAVSKASRDLAHRGKGLALRTGSRLRPDHADDRVLHDRVRSRLGRAVSHPSAIEVSAADGQIVLTGDVLASEVGRLLKSVRSVRGVREVENQLQVHESPGNVSSLQGTPVRQSWVRRNLPPSSRLLFGITGTALCATALRQRGSLGATAGAVGLGLLTRGVTNRPLKQLVGIGAGRRAVQIHKTINVDAPVGKVFQYWASFENFPFFMANVIEVRTHAEGRSHWKVRGPAGTTLEWEAEITRLEPDRVIAWKTLEGAVVESAGIVHFNPNETGGTQVDIQLSYNPPAGALGHSVARLLGRDPKQEMDEDLVRFKSLLEEGKTTAEGLTVTREEVDAVVELGPV